MKYTILHDLHQELGAKMGEFSGFHMPLQFNLGAVKEHEWVRSYAGIFDISHMKQIWVKGKEAAALLSYLTPTNFLNTQIQDGQAKYTVLTNVKGGIIDDLIITKLNAQEFFLVVNAGCAKKDVKWIQENAENYDVALEEVSDKALIAIQGKKAEQVLAMMVKNKKTIQDLPYMYAINTTLSSGSNVLVSRCGYTGEDGFEISIGYDDAIGLFNAFIAHGFVEPIGLIARDSLRLEMGYPLYGNDLCEDTTPIEAGLSWVVSKGHENFIGSDNILEQRKSKPDINRVGIKITGKGIARSGMKIFDLDHNIIGKLTSAGYSPSLKASIGQAYLEIKYLDSNVFVEIRGKLIEARVCKMPFVDTKTKSC